MQKVYVKIPYQVILKNTKI